MFTEFGESLLLQNFREFYSELLRAKRSFSHSQETNGEHQAAPVTPENLRLKLESILLNQERVAAKIGGYFLEPFADARYAMIGFADEVIINSSWEHRKQWQSDLLEMRVNNSYIAGDEFFRRVDRILTERRTNEYIEAAKVYLLCLHLGFKGRFRVEGGEVQTQEYIQRLSEYIFDEPFDTQKPIAPLFRDEDLHVHAKSEQKLFAPAYRRYMFLLGVIALFVVATTIYWLYLTYPIRRTLAEMEEPPQMTTSEKKETPPIRKPVEPGIRFLISDDKGQKLVAQVSIEDATTKSVVNLQSGADGAVTFPCKTNTKLTVSVEAPCCYPQVLTINSSDTTVVDVPVKMMTLDGLSGHPIALSFITFENGKSDLTLTSYVFLDRVVRAMRSCTSFRGAQITGYTDNTCTKITNDRLSRARAGSVVAYFMRNGIAAEKLTATGRGSANPVADNASEAGRAANRRVEITFKK